jgi:hypothetical protein
MNLSEKTTVPLFAVISAVIVGFSSFTGAIVWVSGISSKADAAIQRNSEQEGRMTRISEAMLRDRAIMLDTRDRTIRIEAAVETLLKRTK